MLTEGRKRIQTGEGTTRATRGTGAKGQDPSSTGCS